MKLLPRTRVVPTAVVLGLVAVLIALAVVQYRWSYEVSAAASERMKASMQTSLSGFRHDFYRELGTICAALMPQHAIAPLHGMDVPVPGDLPSVAQRYQSWSRTATHPDLVAGVFIVEKNGEETALLQLNPVTGKFEQAAWPSRLQALKERLLSDADDWPHRPPHPEEREWRNRVRRVTEPPFPSHGLWMVDEESPALVHPLAAATPDDSLRAEAAPMRVLLIALDPKVIREHLFPELAERYFGGTSGLEYNVAVLGADPGDVLYSSNPDFGKATTAADARVSLFGAPFGPPPGMTPQVRGGGRFAGRHDPAFGLPHFEPLRASADSRDWELIVQHRKGSLDAVAAGMRRRNLVVSFGVLLVLAATMAMIIVASQRAHRLAQLQMEFVTGVSHELRTPLAVITSAADNIADGVVESKQQLARYGTVIKKQAGQLNHLIEQILMFAATRQHRLSYTLRPLRVAEVIETSLNQVADLTRDAGYTVDRTIAPNLPPVMGDLPALSHCLQNLITNAVKYGGEDRWIGIRAALADDGSDQVRISVADHGAGIKASELRHIFEPFYRSPDAAAAQIHGTGLGLPLARSIADAMGGRLTVTSEPGHGTTFTLYLPATAEADAGADAAATATS